MAVSVSQLLADKHVHPSDEHLSKLESKWAEIQELKAGLDDLRLDDADIAVRNMPGGDHIVQ